MNENSRNDGDGKVLGHTPEPWDVCDSDNSSFVHVETRHDHSIEAGRQICTVNRGNRAERLSNAGRIADCVNALAGIPDPAEALKVAREALSLLMKNVYPDWKNLTVEELNEEVSKAWAPEIVEESRALIAGLEAIRLLTPSLKSEVC